MPPFHEMLGRLLLFANSPLPDPNPRENFPGGEVRRLAVLERTYPEDYEATDSLSDWEAEPVRIQCHEKKHLSPADAWKLLCDSANLSEDIRARREKVYSVTRGCNLFNVAFAVYLLRGLGEWAGVFADSPGDVLDPCAGWGDRLGAAFISKARSYVGWDTNPALQPVYAALASRYEQAGLTLTWRVSCEPFETASKEEFSTGFDTVIVSPPFFDKEIYGGPQTSTNKYAKVDRWYKAFYQPLWERAAYALRPGGRVIAYIAPGRMFKEADTVLTKAGLIYVGSVGFLQTIEGKKAQTSSIRDAYIWRLEF